MKKITSELYCESGGCSAKISAQELDSLLKNIPVLKPDELLAGIDTHDDAAVWKINDDTAIIQTTDFFPPVCKDAFLFGKISAANALSDVYAMGGDPLLALNIVMYPSKTGFEGLVEILKGGAEKVMEAGAALAGGHTIDDKEPKYGLCVMGKVHPQKVALNSNALPNQTLILSKPLGTGIIIAAEKVNECSSHAYESALENMMSLNKNASLIMRKYNVQCATDITGFSLLGHALRIAKSSNVGIEIFAESLPLLHSSYELADLGCIPSAAFRNLKFVENDVMFDSHIDYNLKMIALDAQTSGGLLMCVANEDADKMLLELHNAGEKQARKIGRTFDLSELPKGEKCLRLNP
jgi:selenide,water dikinase